MFYTEPTNRRLRPDELQTEIEICKWLKRPPRTYINDKPFYPYVIRDPQNNRYPVNFDLNFTE